MADVPGPTKYYRSIGETSRPDWMKWIPDSTSLGNVSMPGTHDTLAIDGGDMVETQEDYGQNGATLQKQLESGIRAIDIRVRVANIEEPVFFTVHHGGIYQSAVYGDVLREMGEFLDAHPSETILLNVKAECTGETGSCKDADGTTDDIRKQIFNSYRDTNAHAKAHFYTPSFTSSATMPTMQDVRGKVVLRSFQTPMGGRYEGYGLAQVTEDMSHFIQDDWEAVKTIFDIDDKWYKVRDHLIKTNADSNKNNMYINFTSASSLGAYPYTVARGTGSAVDDGANKGVNHFAIDYFLDASVERTGVMMMDFPGAALIDSIVAHNYKNVPWAAAIEADAHQTYKNIVYQAGGGAQERANRFYGFMSHVAPQVSWNVGVVKQPYGDAIDPGNHVLMHDILHDEYRFYFYVTDKTDSSVSAANIQAVVDQEVPNLAGDNKARAEALYAKLEERYAAAQWAVFVKEDPGGFENWTLRQYGSTYKKSHGGRTYAAYAVDGAPVPSQDWTNVDNLKWNESGAEAGVPGERVAYFTGWSIYGNGYYLKTLDTNGTAAKLTKLNYAFENIHPTDLTCMAANKPSSNDEGSADGNDGSGDAWADYQKGFTAEESVDGVGDTWGQSLKGNFNQLKKLKAKHPHLKTLVSLGGWTYSKYFSDVAATDASRKKFVTSCVDMYIKGNLPKLGDDPAGGDGAAAGVFDGIDIDWEFPGSPDGHTGNHYSANDTANFTALLAEFRTQLNAAGAGYLLTAALPAGANKIDKLQLSEISSYLDLGNLMTYDMHGGWEGSGPTNFQDPLLHTPDDPSEIPGMNVDAAITAYLDGGFPANKIALGVPFYARGWKGVPDGGKNGLYQSVTGSTDAFAYSQQPGVAFYKELVAAGKMVDGSVFYDTATKTTWVYDGSNFFSVETPKSMTARRQYIKNKSLAGVMMYSLEADDPSDTPLLKAATGIN